MNYRVIPRLDIKGPNLVKGVHFEGLRVLGKPRDFARSYYEQGADELLYVDTVASLYGRNSLTEVVRDTAEELFIPLTVAGGLRNLDDIRRVLRAGADKVAINTAALGDPSLIGRATEEFGSSTIVITIEAMATDTGSWMCYTKYGREPAEVDAVEWAVEAAERGAGELLVTSIDRDGTGNGYALELIRSIAERVSIPVIAGGGAGKAAHCREVLTAGSADAISLASLLHYAQLESLKEAYDKDDFDEEGNVAFLTGPDVSVPSQISPMSLATLKTHLTDHGIPCRRQPHVSGNEG